MFGTMNQGDGLSVTFRIGIDALSSGFRMNSNAIPDTLRAMLEDLKRIPLLILDILSSTLKKVGFSLTLHGGYPPNS